MSSPTDPAQQFLATEILLVHVAAESVPDAKTRTERGVLGATVLGIFDGHHENQLGMYGVMRLVTL